MEKIERKLTDNQKDFFTNLSMYIDTPIYFYGSIYRSDYFPGKSDIDIDIFTDNESSMIQMICNYLQLNKADFKKSFYKIDTTVVRGYKGKYKNDEIGVEVEMAIYNNKYKQLVLAEHDRAKHLPFYISFMLIIVKYFYYIFGVMSDDVYKMLKTNLVNPGSEFKFVLIDS